MGCSHQISSSNTDLEALETTIKSHKSNDRWLSRKKSQPLIEGVVVEEDDKERDERDGSSSAKGVSRTVSLTDEDLEELKGCVDLGFGFNYEEIPELCGTLPALELCYSLSQRFVEEQHKPLEGMEGLAPPPGSAEGEGCSGSSPIPNWKISSPGDHPEDVKARLKFWAQAVACTVKLCS